MDIVEIHIDKLKEAAWNANQMDISMLARLERSIRRYGVVENLVVRPFPDGDYEVLGGNQRLKILTNMGIETIPCVVVELDDAHARLMAQALNHIQGEDDLGLRAEVIQEVIKSISENEVLSILPETAESLKSLASLGQVTIAEGLQKWQEAQSARLKHLQFKLTPKQLEVVDKALTQITPEAKQVKGDSPNVRGTALYLLCKYYLGTGGLSHEQ